MKKSTLIFFGVAAAAAAYFYYFSKNKNQKSSTKIIEETNEPLQIAEVDNTPIRKLVKAPKQLTAFQYNKKTTIKPVAKTLDTIKNALFAKPISFTLNPAGQKAAKKQKAKKAKLGELGATYLYV